MITNYHIGKQYIQQFLPDNPVILEAGAHKGKDTEKLLATWPQATIHAFEPIPELFIKLQEKFHNSPQVNLYNYALSAKTEPAQFNISPECTAISSLLEPTEIKLQKPKATFTPIILESITLEDWAQKYKISKIDFMWLDLQGMELQVLQSMGKLLDTVQVIHTEINTLERYSGATLYSTLKSYLESQNFSLLIEALGPQQWGNALFIRKK